MGREYDREGCPERRERKRENVCVCVCVSMSVSKREREREREREKERERERVRVKARCGSSTEKKTFNTLATFYYFCFWFVFYAFCITHIFSLSARVSSSIKTCHRFKRITAEPIISFSFFFFISQIQVHDGSPSTIKIANILSTNECYIISPLISNLWLKSLYSMTHYITFLFVCLCITLFVLVFFF